MAQPANHAGARPQPLSHPGTPTPTSASSTQQRSMGGLVLPGQNSQGGWQNVQRPAPQQLGQSDARRLAIVPDEHEKLIGTCSQGRHRTSLPSRRPLPVQQGTPIPLTLDRAAAHH